MIFENEKILAKFIQALGGTLWLVGGAVRDTFIGRPVKDRDFVITGINIDSLPFERIAGNQFPVFLVKIGTETVEIAMARSEKKDGVGHKGFEFFTDKSITIEDDLKRRDLTINAMAINVLTREIVDPFYGKQDIIDGILRHINDSFTEDPLRVFRVARFSAELDFLVHKETLAIMKRVIPEINTLPGERVFNEMMKALNSDNPENFFHTLLDVGGLDFFFPEIKDLIVPDKHDGTAFLHTMNLLKEGENIRQRFGLLVHDFGKGRTPKDKHPAHHGHDQLGIDPIKSFCDRLKVPNKLRDFGLLCATQHMKLKIFRDMKKKTLFKFLSNLPQESFDDLLQVSAIDSKIRDIQRVGLDVEADIRELKRFNTLIQEVFTSITGKMLIAEGIEPNRFFGDKLFNRRLVEFKHRLK